MIDLEALQTGLLVLENGSFRRAAQHLHIRPSVVSRRVRALEDGLGVSLFQRQSEGARPTVAGARILGQARTILNDLDDLVRTASRSGSGTEGRLCIGVASSIAGGTARELLRAFQSAHPDVDLDVIEASPNENFAKARALRIDAVVKVGTGPVAGLDVKPLWLERINVALPKLHPLAKTRSVSWDQIADARFIVTKMDPGPDIQDFIISHLAGLGRRPIVEPRAALREGLLALVGLGLGISLVGTAETAVAYPDVVFRPLADEWLPFSLAWAPSNDNPALRRFLSLARAKARHLSNVREGRVIPGEVSSRSLDPSP